VALHPLRGDMKGLLRGPDSKANLNTFWPPVSLPLGIFLKGKI
jgi:hypothetical protein